MTARPDKREISRSIEIDLDKRNSKGPVVTCPDRPSIALMPSDDTPLEIKSSDKLPAEVREMT
jgi:hypothetical protein